MNRYTESRYGEMTDYIPEQNLLAQVDIILKTAGLTTRAVNKTKQVMRSVLRIELENAYCRGLTDGVHTTPETAEKL